jgi:predicted anti-sigma-YlaC factor YlaD
MDCNAYREAISARIDGEDTGLEPVAVDSHLAACPACRSWAERAVAVTRSARVGLAEPIPDLTFQIMAALKPRRHLRIPVKPAPGASPTMIARLGLLMVACGQVFVALPALLGHDAGAPVHVAHEQGAWALALAVGLLVVVARPGRAAALLPFVAALVAGLAITMAVDISAGRTQAAAEAPHGLAFLGLGLLWVLARESRRTQPATATAARKPGMANAA